jgi:hypothetical protein
MLLGCQGNEFTSPFQLASKNIGLPFAGKIGICEASYMIVPDRKP